MVSTTPKLLLAALLTVTAAHELGLSSHDEPHDEYDELIVKPLGVLEEKLRHLPERHFDTFGARFVVGANVSAASTALLPIDMAAGQNGTVWGNNLFPPRLA